MIVLSRADLHNRTASNILLQARQNRDVVFAADAPAALAATKAGTDFTVLEDWVDLKTIGQVVRSAAWCQTNWFDAARPLFTVEGLCWPELDHVAMREFWQEVLMAEVLAKAFLARGCQELVIFGSRLNSPAIGVETNDTRNAFWKALLGKKVVLHHRISFLDLSWLKTLFSKTLKRIGTFAVSRKEAPPAPLPKNPVVLILGHLEALRFRHVVRELQKQFPSQVAVIMGGAEKTLEQEMASIMEFPVTSGAPWPVGSEVTGFLARLPPWLAGREGYSLAKRFLPGLRHVKDKSNGQPWERALRYLDFHFQYYCRYRWPVLHSKTYRYWSALWERFKPKAVMISAFWSTYHLAAILAAKRLGIPTFLLGHGAVALLESSLRSLFVVDHILYETPIQERMYRKAGAPIDRLAHAQGLIAPNEYPSRPLETSVLPPGRYLILVLLEPTSVSGSLIPLIMLKAQMEALRALGNVPVHLKNKVQVLFKVHPYTQDLEVIAATDSRLSAQVLPPDTDLHSVLRVTWLVVATNYTGSALMHVVHTGKPLIHFLTDKTQFDRHFGRLKLFLEAGDIVQTDRELWETVERLLENPATYEHAALRTREFCRIHLGRNVTSPTIGEAVLHCLKTRDSAAFGA